MQKLQSSSLLLFLLLFSFSSNAKNWYVDDALNTNDIYTVGSAAGSDAAVGTALAPLANLSKAITLASAGDFIYVDAGTFSGVNNSGINNNMVINKSLNIYGAGPNLTFFNGTSNNYFLKITANNIVVENMKVSAYGNSASGQANSVTISAETSNLTGISFENVWFDKCLGAAGDGSVRIGGNGTYSVAAKFESCLFTCNGAGLYGGAFYIKGDKHKIDISSCYFESNERSSPGGAIYIEGTNSNLGTSTIVTIQKSTFKNNTSGNSTNGGGIWVEGATLNVLSSCFNNNKCTNLSGYGNAICGGKSSKINLSNSSFESNSGGKGHQVSVSTVYSNMNNVSPTGSVDLTVDNCYFDGSTASTSATGIYFKGSTCTITNSTFTLTTKIQNGGGTFKMENSGNPTYIGTINFINTTASLTTATPPCIVAVTGQCSDPSGLVSACPTVFHPIINAASITLPADPSCNYVVPTYTATDFCTPSANIIMTQTPAANSALAAGTTTAVIITATDPTTLISKTITVNLTTPTTGCTTTLPVSPKPVINTAEETQYFCTANGANHLVSELKITGGNNVKWYSAATGGTAIAPTTSLVSGDYYASQTNANSLESTDRTKVVVVLLGVPTLTIVNPAAVCSPATVDITLQPAVITTDGTKLTYWSDNSATTAIPDETAITTSATYYIKSENATNDAACSIVRPVVVTINAIPTLTITDPATVCSPTTVDITSSSVISTNGTTLSYWSDALATTAITNQAAITASNTYYIKSDNGTCSVIKPVVVTISNPSAPTASSSTQTFCVSSLAKVSDLSATGLAGSTITWYNAASAGTAYPSADLLIDGRIYYASQTTTATPACESTSRLAVTVAFSNAGITITGQATQTFCSDLYPSPKVSDLKTTNGSTILWYAAPTGGTALPTTDLLIHSTKYYATVSGCESSTRFEVLALIQTTPLVPTTNFTQNFCSINSKKVSDLSATGSAINWYNSTTTGSAVLNPTTGLIAGSYFATQTVGSCESSKTTVVTVTVNDPAKPTTSSVSQSFCSINTKTVADLSVNEPTIVWYTSASSTISNTALNPNTALVSGKYYATQKVNGCESVERLEVTVTVNDPAKPTTSSATQSFCAIDTKKITDLSVNEPTIVWYTSASSTISNTALNPNTALVNGKYYAAQKVGLCESDERLEVTVTVNDPAKPTTSSATQSFCAIDTKKITDLSVNEPTIVWYTSASSTISNTALNPNTALVSGKYYATQKVNGCESSQRLEITLTVNDPAAPTTTSISQSFCSIDSKKVSDLSATGIIGSAITWYTSATVGGVALNPTTALVNGTYYATQRVGSCESKNRLAVSVNIIITPTASITPQSTTTFCQGGFVILNASTGTGYTYEWYKDGNIINGSIGNSYTAIQSGNYTVKVINGACNAASIPTAVTITTLSTPTISAQGNTTFCQGGFVVLNASSGNGASSYEWYKDGNIINGSVGNSYTAIQTGNYSVKIISGVCNSSSSNISVSVLNCAGITENEISKIKIYPNPTSDELNIETPFSEGNIVLINVLGKVVLTSELSDNKTKLDIKELATGNYTLIIKNNQQTIETKIVKL